jgi:hypothetical protein
MKAIYLEPDQVPGMLKGAYSGRQFKAIVCETATIPMDAGLWSGGSRETYRAVNLDTGIDVPLRGQNAAPWDAARREHEISLAAGVVVICHSMFCGKDMGLTFYVHPANATKLLPANTAGELSETELLVLEATASLKSSYGGKDRYEMSRHNARYSSKAFPTREQWEQAKQSLIARKLLNKAGAITTAGRNARPSRY